MKRLLRWLFKHDWDELADRLDRENFEHYLDHRHEITVRDEIIKMLREEIWSLIAERKNKLK